MNRALKWTALASLAASAMLALSDDPATTPSRESSTHAQVSPQIRRAAQRRLAASGPARNLFLAQDWSTAGAASAPRIAPPPRAASLAPLPFTLAGVWQDNGARVVFVQDGPQVLALCDTCDTPGALHPGALLTGGYRLEVITSDQIEFTHLPDQQPQRLRIEP